MSWSDPSRAGAVRNPHPSAAPVDVAAQAHAGFGPPPPRPRSRGLLVLAAIAAVALAVLALVTGAVLVSSLGPVAVAVGGILALVPLGIVLLGVNWIDRWEPEPRGVLVLAFLWGAGLAVLAALVFETGASAAIAALAEASSADLLRSAVAAPIIEETGKGLGVLVIYFAARRHFDSPVDGIVYAAWVAGGFAFTENILYFGSAVVSAGGIGPSVIYIFIVRGLMSPFAHVIFTACTGIALGIAARRTGVLGSIGAFVLGLVPAVLLHALWNGALAVVPDFFGYYIVVQVPIFLFALVLVIYLRRAEARLTFDRLREYAAAGWFAPAEVVSLATGTGRRQALAWAASRGLGPVMRRYVRDATRLAFTRQRIVTGRGGTGAALDEETLLTSIVEERAILQGALRR